MESRAKRVFKYVGDDVDAVLFMNEEEPNLDTMFPYVTGTTSGLFEQCIAAAWPNGHVDILTNLLEETSARDSKANVIVFHDMREKEKIIKDLFGKSKRIGVNAKGLSYNHLTELRKILPKAEFIDVSSELLKAKMVKDGEELERLRNACDIASKVGKDIPDFLKPGMSEFEGAAEINYRMQKYGASAPSFTTITSYGANSAEPHHEPDETKLKKSDIALFDYGALYRKYGSDVTRTFFVGNATEEQKRMYNTVLEAQLAAITEIRPGLNGSYIDSIARNIIDSTEFKGLLIHSLGHSIGLSVHDGVRMAPNTDLVLEEGMVLTVEPGVYVKGKGGVRIEDDIVVTRNGCEVLTKAPKDLLVI
jgi:Xaa-Pro dipeptidase